MNTALKIGIVGIGQVGSTTAYSLVLQGVGSELVLVDQNRALAEAHVMDILHATPFSHPVHLRSGDFSDLVGCGLVIVAAGVGQLPGETRMQLLQRNAAIFANIVPRIVRHAADAILLVATNPLDVMTQITHRLAGLPAGRVLGSGTILDTARFRALLGELCKVSPSSVHAYVLGEHGDSEVLLWSGAEIAGIPLEQFAALCGCPLTTDFKNQVDQSVRRAAYRIIDGKGATYYGIGAALARLSRCILYDERTVFTACSVVPEVEGVTDVALSLPLIIGQTGIQATLRPPMNQDERKALHESALLIKSSAASLGY
ncbi:L-lactate dehydrogenase [Candidatus Nitrotoga sp. AM1P]|uniref:L-lactate dehydrogenase n=1 Tax=Candidatus Nitrotoga sp. AM1P TaxID=2559597 RepID=UPI0010B12C88|nr:L-lactate dehydrogenase [Candidatus Nitrotoga sp. AM1P]BBJ24446.1 L-lactate dehydrogenase [Candidatus Nitrotoga sp. AM1P]